MKIYVSRYALTHGIEEVEAEERDIDIIRDQVWFYHKGNGYSDIAIGKDWSYNKDDAIKNAKELKAKKIKELKKQIAKLEKLSFE